MTISRRQLLTTIVPIAVTHRVATGDRPLPVANTPVETVAVQFAWHGEDGVRTLFLRARRVPTDTAAIAMADATIESAGPPSRPPHDEYSASDPVALDLTIAAPAADDVRAMIWGTVAGVAAYTTIAIVFVVRHGNLLWDGTVTAGSHEAATQLAFDMASHVAEPPASFTPLASLLPTAADLPDGATIVHTEPPATPPPS